MITFEVLWDNIKKRYGSRINSRFCGIAFIFLKISHFQLIPCVFSRPFLMRTTWWLSVDRWFISVAKVISWTQSSQGGPRENKLCSLTGSPQIHTRAPPKYMCMWQLRQTLIAQVRCPTNKARLELHFTPKPVVFFTFPLYCDQSCRRSLGRSTLIGQKMLRSSR